MLDDAKYTPHYKHLFRAVARWCPDPPTFLSFALSCRLAAECCREFTAMKQHEFCDVICDSQGWQTRILPNGFWHGFRIFLGLHTTVSSTYYNGYWVQQVQLYHNDLDTINPRIAYSNNETRRMRCVRNIVIDKIEYEKITLSNPHTTIRSTYCPCGAFHRFRAGRFIYYRGCRETNYHVKVIGDANQYRWNDYSFTRRRKLLDLVAHMK